MFPAAPAHRYLKSYLNQSVAIHEKHQSRFRVFATSAAAAGAYKVGGGGGWLHG